jgi:electron transfer flavoprotein alpha subunit/transcriptional regulator with XRE-family HTH domain
MATTTETEVWVYVDLRNQRFLGYSMNVLGKAREVSRALSCSVAVVLMGSSGEKDPADSAGAADGVNVEFAEKRCFTNGADRVYILDDRRLSMPRADIHAAEMAKMVEELQPRLVLFALTEFGREMAARAAMACSAGLIAGCMDIIIKNGDIIASCPSWGGEIMAEIAFAKGFRTGFLTVEPHAFRAKEISSPGNDVVRIEAGTINTPKGIKLLSRGLEPEAHRKLEEAESIVVGGSGLGSSENFALVRQLAASLGGEVGATRPPVIKHWVDEEQLIGQTGKTVRPKLLFSIGTSGAIQYTAGITESDTIVAVNRDPNAPIFQIADFGIVADAKTFLPNVITRINQTVMRSLADDFFEKQGRQGDSGFGEKLRKLRESKNWSLETLSQAIGDSPEFINQVENEEISPSVSFLLRLAGAFKVDPGTFLRKEEKTLIRNMRAQALTKRTQNYSYQTLTMGAETDHLHGFMITIESKQTHKPVAYKHEGEEFVFVLEGELELTVGNRVHNLKPGESLHFNSDTPHKLKNLSYETTRCLVVLFTP